MHSEVLVHLLVYIRDNTTLSLKHYAYMNDAPVSDLLVQAIIKTDNHLMALYDYNSKDCTDTGKGTEG